MTPKETIRQWIDAFNLADAEKLGSLYAENAVNHQVAYEPIEGREAIKSFFKMEFSRAEMVCITENIFEDGEWAILEWKDPKGLRGCGFFRVEDGLIRFQRGYFDKLSFYKLHNIPLESRDLI